MPPKHRKTLKCRKNKRKKYIIRKYIIVKKYKLKECRNRCPNPCIPPMLCIPPNPCCPCNNIEIEATAMRFFLIPTSNLTTPITIPADQFVDDNGNNISSFPNLDENSIVNFYINGIMQPSSLYKVTPNSLTINSTGDTIYSGTSLILETVQLSSNLIPSKMYK
ncbi:DUF4183 domain-containing protein [Laceyella putida]|uniref:DUF4183 domain-containing protein n=1 Tax=Laceyella putida TaxID=110101 RepID=A0ABW2RKX0_9BACL